MIYNNKVTASTPLLHDIVPFREKIGFGWFLKGMWLREKKKNPFFCAAVRSRCFPLEISPCWFPNFLVAFPPHLPASLLLCLNRKMALQADRPVWCLWLYLYPCQCTGSKQTLRGAGLRGDLAWVSGPQDSRIANRLSSWLVGDRSETPWRIVMARLVLWGDGAWISPGLIC